MKPDRPYRVGVFRSRADALRVADEARRAGFRKVRVLSPEEHVVEYRRDPGQLPGRLEGLTVPTLPHAVRLLPLEGALLGALCGFFVAWGLGAVGELDMTFGYVVLPVAGFVFFGFVGAM